MKIMIEDLLKRSPSVYKLTNMAIKRALELDKEMPQTGAGENQGPINIALNEILEGKLSYK